MSENKLEAMKLTDDQLDEVVGGIHNNDLVNRGNVGTKRNLNMDGSVIVETNDLVMRNNTGASKLQTVKKVAGNSTGKPAHPSTISGNMMSC